jgi:hypothetical protein
MLHWDGVDRYCVEGLLLLCTAVLQLDATPRKE